ncbi:hypothetical protein JW949_03390 [Candidatus Woesearchaeota archaeon]|jgi:hypothetical protein|nr:hypothetical protein [Candidatus Woesearchaeota archaeon]
MEDKDKIVEDAEELVEDDEIDASEEGFMEGYDEDKANSDETDDDIIDPDGESFYNESKKKKK